MRTLAIAGRRPRMRLGCEVCEESLAALGRRCADHVAAEAEARGERTASCVRFYPNGEFRREPRVPADLETWLEYNRTFRPGNSLFVEGRCAQRGAGFTDEDCSDIERALATGTPWTPRR